MKRIPMPEMIGQARAGTGARAAAIALAIMSFFVSACGSPGASTRLKAAYRFVDGSERAEMTVDYGAGPFQPGRAARTGRLATVSFPAASINDETRFVLGAPAQSLVANTDDVPVSNRGVAQITLRFPPRLANASRMLLLPSIKKNKSWQPLAQQRLNLSGTATSRIAFAITGLEKEIGGKHSFAVDAYSIDWGPDVSYETRDVAVGEDARLEFGYGILEPAWDQGPVTFTISACLDSNCEELFAYKSDPTNAIDRRWRDAACDLTRFAGKTVRFLFETRHESAASDSFSLPVWANPTVYVPAPADDDRPNVILLSIDTLRADHLSVYGHEHETSPFIDRTFGEGGTVFENPVSAASNTSPSHMSIFTGLQPSEHGIQTGLERLPIWMHPLAEPLRAAGIETGAVTENGWLSVRHGFGRGFNIYAENKSPNIMAPTGQVDVTFRRASEWLARNANKHFFLFLHTFQVHDPYAPPFEYRNLFVERNGETVGDSSERHLREAVAYDQEIRYTDDQLDLLFRALRANNLDKNTLFIITSDHGEAFLEHGFVRHSAHLYQEVTHVPLLFWGPGVPRGRRVNNLVGHIDLAPTIFDVLGIDQPFTMTGRSLLPLLANGEAAVFEDRPHYSESWSKHAMNHNYLLSRFGVPAFGVRFGDLKLARYKNPDGSFRYEAYDLSVDPYEKNNLFGTSQDPTEKLRKLIDSYEQRTRDASDKLRRESGNLSGPAKPEKLKLDPAQEEKLRALGYLN
jgi:arylsulfatase A-like enzyme